MSQPNYWVFQANPKHYKIIDALQDDAQGKPLRWNWMVNQHRKRIQEGDKVIIWVCGKHAGVYALATVTSRIKVFSDADDPFYVDPSKAEARPRVYINIDKNMIHKPILRPYVLTHPDLSDMSQGFRGTNFKASPIHFSAIEHLCNQ